MNEREESEDSEKRNVFEKLHCVKRQKAIVGFHKFSGSGILASSDHLHFSSQTSFASLYLFKAIGLKKQMEIYLVKGLEVSRQNPKGTTSNVFKCLFSNITVF